MKSLEIKSAHNPAVTETFSERQIRETWWFPTNRSMRAKLIMPWKTITRKELYDEVWSTPVSKLAPKYNLSDVGFAKFCKRCDIPRPTRGYWAKLEAGQKVKRTPLPKHDEEGEIKVHVPEPGEVEAKEKARVETEKRENLLPKIEVAESLRGCHRLVSAANDAFEGAKKRDDGLLHTPEGCQLDLLVSRDQLRRSLLVSQANNFDELVPLGVPCQRR